MEEHEKNALGKNCCPFSLLIWSHIKFSILHRFVVGKNEIFIVFNDCHGGGKGMKDLPFAKVVKLLHFLGRMKNYYKMSLKL